MSALDVYNEQCQAHHRQERLPRRTTDNLASELRVAQVAIKRLERELHWWKQFHLINRARLRHAEGWQRNPRTPLQRHRHW